MSAVAISYGIDRFVVQAGAPDELLLWWNDAVIGVFAFVVALVLLAVSGRARDQERARLDVIPEVNHHAGNALQVVRLHQAIEGDPEMTAQIDDAINRIEWVLREVLPQVNSLETGPDRDAGGRPWEEAPAPRSSTPG